MSMPPRPSAIVVALVAVVGSISSQPTAQPSRMVLKGATVITATDRSPILDAVLVIEGDTIQSVGGAGTSSPAGAETIDLSGKFIIPGLVESHAHYEEWMGELMLNHGVTTAFAIGGNFREAKSASQDGAARTPRMFDTAGDPRVSPDMSEEQVREGVRAWLKGNPDFARLRDYTEGSSQAYAWAADEIHRAGLLVFGHTMNAPASIRAGQDVVEHIWGFIMPFMSGKEQQEFRTGQHLHWSLFLKDWPTLDRAIKEAVSAGVYLNPTLVYELGSLSAHAARQEQEVYELNANPALRVYYPQNIAESLIQRQRQIRNFARRYENLVLLSRLQPAEREQFARGYALAGQFLKRWVDAGGKIQAGTDTVSGGTPGLSLLHEMELLVEAGLTPLQALKSATVWSAEMLAGKNGARGQPKVGTIRPGGFADLVVLSADPLASIGNAKRIERVMKGGRFVSLGYEPSYYSFTRPARSIAMATPAPELSAISPHTVLAGSPEVDLTIYGIGFVGQSVVRIDNVAMPTTFVNPRTLRTKVPAALLKSATPNPFDAPGPEQEVGVFGDRTLHVTVFNAPPEGGVSDSISLRVRPKWMGLEDEP